jgi:hypothetical protein
MEDATNLTRDFEISSGKEAASQKYPGISKSKMSTPFKKFSNFQSRKSPE